MFSKSFFLMKRYKNRRRAKFEAMKRKQDATVFKSSQLDNFFFHDNRKFDKCVMRVSIIENANDSEVTRARFTILLHRIFFFLD